MKVRWNKTRNKLPNKYSIAKYAWITKNIGSLSFLYKCSLDKRINIALGNTQLKVPGTTNKLQWLRPIVIVNEILEILIFILTWHGHTQTSYIFDVRSGFRGTLNRVFTSASMSRHFSWFSKVSRFHASAIACAGDTGVVVALVAFVTFLCGDGESAAICQRNWSIQWMEWNDTNKAYRNNGPFGEGVYEKEYLSIFISALPPRAEKYYWSSTDRTVRQSYDSHPWASEQRGSYIRKVERMLLLDQRNRNMPFRENCVLRLGQSGQWGNNGNRMFGLSEALKEEWNVWIMKGVRNYSVKILYRQGSGNADNTFESWKYIWWPVGLTFDIEFDYLIRQHTITASFFSLALNARSEPVQRSLRMRPFFFHFSSTRTRC